MVTLVIPSKSLNKAQRESSVVVCATIRVGRSNNVNNINQSRENLWFMVLPVENRSVYDHWLGVAKLFIRKNL